MVGWSEKFLFMIFEIQHLLRLDTSWISEEESDHNLGQELPTEKTLLADQRQCRWV